VTYTTITVQSVRQAILAGLVLAVRQAQTNGADPLYLAGALAQAEHLCIATCGDWPGLVGEAREALGVGYEGVLNGALSVLTV